MDEQYFAKISIEEYRGLLNMSNEYHKVKKERDELEIKLSQLDTKYYSLVKENEDRLLSFIRSEITNYELSGIEKFRISDYKFEKIFLMLVDAGFDSYAENTQIIKKWYEELNKEKKEEE